MLATCCGPPIEDVMIDHTRAFRLGKELLKLRSIERVERTLFEKMRELEPKLADAMGKSMTKAEIDALLARRDVIVKLFDDDRAARRGRSPYSLAN